MLGGNRSDCLGLYFGQPLAPADLVLDCIGFAQQVRAQVADFVLQLFVLVRRLPVPGFGSGLGNQLPDIFNNDLQLLVTIHYRSQHDFFR